MIFRCSDDSSFESLLATELGHKCNVRCFICCLEHDALDLHNIKDDESEEMVAGEQWGVSERSGLQEDIQACSGLIVPFTSSVRALTAFQLDLLFHTIDMVLDRGRCLITLLEKNSSLSDLQNFYLRLEMNVVLTVDINDSSSIANLAQMVENLLCYQATRTVATNWYNTWTDALIHLQKLYVICLAASHTYPDDGRCDRDPWTVFVQVGRGLLIQLLSYLCSTHQKGPRHATDSEMALSSHQEYLLEQLQLDPSVNSLGLRSGKREADYIRQAVADVYPHCQRMQSPLPSTSSYNCDQLHALQVLQQSAGSLCDMIESNPRMSKDEWARMADDARVVLGRMRDLLTRLKSEDELYMRLSSLEPFVAFLATSRADSFSMQSTQIYCKLLRLCVLPDSSAVH